MKCSNTFSPDIWAPLWWTLVSIMPVSWHATSSRAVCPDKRKLQVFQLRNGWLSSWDLTAASEWNGISKLRQDLCIINKIMECQYTKKERNCYCIQHESICMKCFSLIECSVWNLDWLACSFVIKPGLLTSLSNTLPYL